MRFRDNVRIEEQKPIIPRKDLAHLFQRCALVELCAAFVEDIRLKKVCPVLQCERRRCNVLRVRHNR